MSEPLRCVLCDATGPDVAVSLVWWKELAYQAVDAAPRCRDRAACRKRVEAAGKDWPVLEPARKVTA